VPDELLGGGGLQLFFQEPSYLGDARVSVAMLPDERSRLIQAMSLVALFIIDQRFAAQFFNYKLFVSRVSSSATKSASIFSSDDYCPATAETFLLPGQACRRMMRGNRADAESVRLPAGWLRTFGEDS
jgi:hypothetical protein